jgi:hypothetical protein
MVIEPPVTSNLGPVVHYMGLPDVHYASEPASRGVILGLSALAPTANNVVVTDTPGEAASVTASANRPVQVQLTPKNPNSAGRYHISDIFVGDAAEGLRFNLSGLYSLPTTGVVNGDIITIGTRRFRVIVAQTLNYNSFGSQALAIQIPSA